MRDFEQGAKSGRGWPLERTMAAVGLLGDDVGVKARAWVCSSITYLSACTGTDLHIEQFDELRVDMPLVAAIAPRSNPKAVRVTVGTQEIAVDVRPLASPDRPHYLHNAYARAEVEDAYDLCDELSDVLKLAAEHEATVFEVEMDASVEFRRVVETLDRLGTCKHTRDIPSAIKVRTPFGHGTLTMRFGFGPWCNVDGPGQSCAAPSVYVGTKGLSVSLWEQVLPPEDEPECMDAVSSPVPRSPWARHHVETDVGKCPLLLWGRNSFDDLRDVMNAVDALAPRCPRARLLPNYDLPWSKVAPVHSVLELERGYAVGWGLTDVASMEEVDCKDDDAVRLDL